MTEARFGYGGVVRANFLTAGERIMTTGGYVVYEGG
jgi:hypothetical protein